MGRGAGGWTPPKIWCRRWSQAFSAGGVHVVAVPIDYAENTRVLIEELRNRAPELEPA